MWQDIPLYCHNGHYYRQIHNLGQFKCTQHAADFNERANQWPCCGKPHYNPGCVPADHNTHTFRYEKKHSVHGMPEELLAMFRNGPGVVGNVIHRFDRDEDERLNPYLSNGYTLKKPRVEKRPFKGETLRRLSPAQPMRRLDVRPQSGSREDDSLSSSDNPVDDDDDDGAGTGFRTPDFGQSGELQPPLGVATPFDEVRQMRGFTQGDASPARPVRQPDVRPQTDSREDDDDDGDEQPGESQDQPTGLISRLVSRFRGDGAKKQPEAPRLEGDPKTRKGMASWSSPWRPTPAEQESSRLNQEALEERQREFERRVEREEGNIKVGFAEIEEEAERVGALTDQLQSEIAEAKRLQKKSQAELGEAETLRKTYNDAIADLEQRETNLTKRDEGLTAIHKQIEEQFGTVELLTKDIELRRGELEQLNTRIGSLELDVFSLEADKREVERLQGLKTRVTVATKDLHGRYEQKEAKLKVQISEKQRELEDLTKDLGTIETLQSTLGQVRGERKTLKQQKEQLTEQHKAETKKLSQERDASDTRALQAEQRSNEQKKEIDRLNADIAELTKQLKESETGWQGEKELFELEIAQKSADIEELTRKVEKKKSVVKDLEELLQDQKKNFNAFHELLDQEIVVDFIPSLAYLRTGKKNEYSFLSDLFTIFMDEGRQIYTEEEDFATVLGNIIRLFQLDEPQIKKMEEKSFFKIWYDKYG